MNLLKAMNLNELHQELQKHLDDPKKRELIQEELDRRGETLMEGHELIHAGQRYVHLGLPMTAVADGRASNHQGTMHRYSHAHRKEDNQ